MADTFTARSPLQHAVGMLQRLPTSVQVREIPLLGQLNLRLDPDGAAAGRMAEVLGFKLPATCLATRAASYEALWLGPDEWLVLVPRDQAVELAAGLRAAIGDEHGAVTDVSAQRTAVTLTGPSARELLAMGCAIDFHPSVAPIGTCVQTLLAQTGIIIVVRGEQDYLMLVRQSFAQYLVDWLVTASAGL